MLLSSGLTGATIGMISAPNGPVTILLSGLVVRLAPTYSPHEVFVILGVVLFFTGLFQVIFGLLGRGEIIKLIPYPVVASMITAIGILMIKSQFSQIMPAASIDGWSCYIPLIVAVVTVIAIFLVQKYFPRLPELLVGLFTGIIVYFLLACVSTNSDPNWVIGTLPVIEFTSILERFDGGLQVLTFPWQLIITSALALSVLVMIDTLLTALVADTQTSSRHNARKELVAQGVAQMIIGVVGGVGGGGTKGSTLANTMAGGRRWSPLFAALLIVLMVFFGREVGALLPLSALSGVIIYIGIKMININIILWFKDKYTKSDAINAFLVISTTLIFDITKAVALGVAFAIITFLRTGIKRSLIRRETNICDYPSPRRRSSKHRKILKEYGDKGLLIELQDNIYFAKTDLLYRLIMEKVVGRTIIILHFRRVLSIDMSGMVLLMHLVKEAEKNGTEIVFTHLHRHLGFGRKMKKAFCLIEGHEVILSKIFHSTARALEYAEDQILRSEYKNKEYRISSPVSFEDNDLCKEICPDDIGFLKKISLQKEYGNKETILAEGEKSSSLYLLTSGFVEQRLYNGPISYKVLVKFSPGTYFGKAVFFNLGPVSTRFVALGDTTLYKIRRKDIEQESDEVDKKFFANILFAIGKNLSKESERYIAEIRRLEAL